MLRNLTLGERGTGNDAEALAAEREAADDHVGAGGDDLLAQLVFGFVELIEGLRFDRAVRRGGELAGVDRILALRQGLELLLEEDAALLGHRFLTEILLGRECAVRRTGQ